MKIYTIEGGVVREGAHVERVEKSGYVIFIIRVGQDGRGRKEGWLVVDDRMIDQRTDHWESVSRSYKKPGEQTWWSECSNYRRAGADDNGVYSLPPHGKAVFAKDETTTETTELDGTVRRAVVRQIELFPVLEVRTGRLGQTQSGKPKLVTGDDSSTDCLVVLRTQIGYRGGNSLTGDRTDPGKPEVGNWGDPGYQPEVPAQFAPFPGRILATGTIAQGAAGRAGSGDQHVAVLPKGAIFRTAYSGRLYGGPSHHYFFWDGQKIHGGLTRDERDAVDVW